MYDIGQASTFEGLPSEISESASPGILWLQKFWMITDTLDISGHPSLIEVVTSDCQFHINGAAPRHLGDMHESFQKRAGLLSEFGHTKYPVRIIDVDLGEGKRLLSVQSTSVSVLKPDTEQTELRVAESTFVDLETINDTLFANKVSSCLDPTPVVVKLQVLLAADAEAREQAEQAPADVAA